MTWCRANGCEWGNASLLNRAAWEARRRSHKALGEKLPPADCILWVTQSGLYEVLNQRDPGGCKYNDLSAWLRQHGLGVQRLSPHYARLYYLNPPKPG